MNFNNKNQGITSDLLMNYVQPNKNDELFQLIKNIGLNPTKRKTDHNSLYDFIRNYLDLNKEGF